MIEDKKYYRINNFDLGKMLNIEEKNVIHEFDSKSIVMDIEKLRGEQIINNIR